MQALNQCKTCNLNTITKKAFCGAAGEEDGGGLAEGEGAV